VRVTLANDATRITLIADGPLRAEIFTLDSPDRVVVDLPVLTWPDQASVPLPRKGVISHLRFGRFDPRTSRLVLDLREPVKVAGTEMHAIRGGRTRLQIDLKATNTRTTIETRTTVEPGRTGETVVRGPSEAPSDQPAKPPPPSKKSNVSLGDSAKGDAVSKADGRHVVAIDPGHGGVDPGATGARGTLEKTVTLAAGRELRRQLEATGNYRVVMTRTSDVYVPLSERVEIARSAGAELFISLHADKHENARIRGATVYTLSEKASDAETEAYAKRENSSDIVAGIDLGSEYDAEVARILISLVQQSTMNCSALFASTLVKQVKKQTATLPRPHRFAGFRVLKAPDVPSVLVELGYLSNPTDEKGLRNAATRARLMKAVVRAIDAYFARQNC